MHPIDDDMLRALVIDTVFDHTGVRPTLSAEDRLRILTKLRTQVASRGASAHIRLMPDVAFGEKAPGDLDGSLPALSFEGTEDQSVPQDTFSARARDHTFAKAAIGQGIAVILRHAYKGQAVGIDGGTTNLWVAQAIRRISSPGRPSVGLLVTNHCEILELLTHGQVAIPVFSTGGQVRKDRRTLIGEEAIHTIRRFDLAVSSLGINGVNLPDLLTTTGVENDVKKAFIEQSRDIIIGFDAAKTSWASGMRLANLYDLVGRPRRTVSLVTCYPSLDAQEEDRGCTIRYHERFMETMVTLFSELSRHGVSLTVNLMTVDVSGTSLVPPALDWQCVMVEPRSIPDFDSLYCERNRNGHPGIAMLVQLELRSEGSQATLDNEASPAATHTCVIPRGEKKVY